MSGRSRASVRASGATMAAAGVTFGFGYLTTSILLLPTDKFANDASLIVTLQYDQDAFPTGVPQISAVIRGAKVLGRSVESRGFIGAALDTRGRFGAFGPGNLETVTDSDGAFELTGVRPGNFRLAVRAPRFAPHDDDDIVVPAGQAHDVGTITLLASPVRIIDWPCSRESPNCWPNCSQ